MPTTADGPVTSRSPSPMEMLDQAVSGLSESVVDLLHSAERCHLSLFGPAPSTPRSEGPLDAPSGRIHALAERIREIQSSVVDARETLSSIETQIE